VAESQAQFHDPNLKEVHLPNAPLVRVIAQVRYPVIASIEDMKFIGNFQESLRHSYPNFSSEKSIMVNAFDLSDRRESTIWRFQDKNNEWRITLSPEFLAIESFAYKSRDDFFSRFDSALASLKEKIGPDSCERLGVRYIDQIKGAEFEKINTLVRPEVLDIYKSELGQYVSSSIRQSLLTFGDDQKLIARYGILQGKQTYDPASVNVINENSWILDLDVYSDLKKDFDCKVISSQARSFADCAYRFFRWTVTNEFLTTYGGAPE
jgi:uncharacterized protein (TIGR04255 family)